MDNWMPIEENPSLLKLLEPPKASVASFVPPPIPKQHIMEKHVVSTNERKIETVGFALLGVIP